MSLGRAVYTRNRRIDYPDLQLEKWMTMWISAIDNQYTNLHMITFNTESTHILVAVMVYIWEPPISVPPPNPNPLPH